MALAAGTRLGPHEIIAPIGAGGMGEVYKARDTRLDRIVAIKVSKDQFSARFEREARAVAALNDPHVCHLYDVGPNYLVMEFVEGAPIRPSDDPQQLLDLAVQIADGLAAAHAAGIVHRDLKPGNILVTGAGQVKILDFGLATMSAASAEAMAARVTEAVTDSGVTVGTAAYMSPEQARGKTVDARSDLWSLGVVLYEMASRVRPFDGPTAPVIFEAVLGKMPVPVRERNPKVSPELARIIGRLLEKDKALRYQSAADLGSDLKRVERDSSSGAVAAAAPTTHEPRRLPKYAIGVAGAVVLAFVASAAALFYSVRPAVPVTSPSEYVQLTNFNDSATAPSLSPDGRMVTFIRGGQFCCGGGAGQIYVKLLPSGESVRLTSDATGPIGPVFTPDGSRIAYTSGQSLGWETWTVPVLGGQPSRLLPNAFGLTWIADDHVLFSQIKTGAHLGIVTATEGRAESREIYFPAEERAMAHFSHLSPDRKSVLIVEMGRTGAWQSCRLVPFDGSSAGRQVGPQGGCLSTGWSPDGKWMYFSVRVGSSSHLWRQKFPDGLPEQITFGPNEEEGVALSPDGRSVITSVGTHQSALWIHDAMGERAISSEGYANAPLFSRDGSHVFFLFRRDSTAASAELRSLDLASGKIDSVLQGSSVLDYDVSPDDKDVAFTTPADGGEPQIWLASVDRRTPARLVARAGDRVSFGADGYLVFRSLDEKTANFLSRIKRDGSGREHITSVPIIDKFSVSADGEVALAGAGTREGASSRPQFLAVPVRGGESRNICCLGKWSRDGKFFHTVTGTGRGSRPLAIPVPPGKSLPDLQAAGVLSATSAVQIPDMLALVEDSLAPGGDPSTYVFVKRDLRRNLFRIPLH